MAEKCFLCEIQDAAEQIYGVSNDATNFIARQLLRVTPNPAVKLLGTPISAARREINDALFEGMMGQLERASEGELYIRETINPEVKKVKRKLSGYQKQFGKELKKIKEKSRLKSGRYRKGWDRQKEFLKTHQMTRKFFK